MIGKFLNIILLLFLTVSIVLSTTVPSLIFTTYQINKKEITEKYCVNKNKPELKCHGKCHMKDQLEQAEQSKSGQEKSLPPIKELNFHFWTLNVVSDWKLYPTFADRPGDQMTVAISEGFPFHEDHPPKQYTTIIA